MKDQPSIPFHVFKFGGTSVGTAERIRNIVQLMQAEPETARRVVVVSALGGVTDRLIAAIEAALDRTDTHRDILESIRHRHQETLADLVSPEDVDALHETLTNLWRDLGELLDGVYLLRECTLRTRDAVIGMGERASAPIIAAAFRAAGTDAIALDARTLVRTDVTFGEANVQFEATNALIQARFEEIPASQIAIVTGFIATTDTGVATTLGRSGSDYTATILAGALNAQRAVIWTDVDGVLSADPRLVPLAFTLKQLSYREAAEMAYFGAKVLHPRTMRPLIEQDIPLFIKNTMNPASSGTLIWSAPVHHEGYVKAVTAIEGVALVMLEGTGMIGIPGISARTFGALAAQQINVLLISQASSEQSICIGVSAEEAEAAVAALQETFALELDRRDISQVYATTDCAVISVVGDQMRMQPGLAGHMFSTLGRANINVLAIAQGAAETNISAVVQSRDARHAVRALHEAFARSNERAHLFLLGAGGVGKALLDILETQAPVLLEELKLNLHLVGLSNSRHQVWDVEGVAFSEAMTRLEASDVPMDLDALIAQFVDSHIERLIVIDATASDEVALRYMELLGHGIAVVTPNKRANTQQLSYYKDLQVLSQRKMVPYLYETTVGAGLPVLSTLRDLCHAGDRIEKIEGVFSGTLAHLFNSMAEGAPFSDAVREAKALGYTEPDPRDDLKGEDVARKLLTLAREMGLYAERSNVEVESLVPEALQGIPVDQFMERLSEADGVWKERLETATALGQRLQYIGTLEGMQLKVGVQAVDATSAFAHLRGTDNLIAYTTARYHTTPLIIQGPGAGPEVTAGVLSDIVKAAQAMA